MAISLILIGCDRYGRHKFLSTIFDGVPPLEKKEPRLKGQEEVAVRPEAKASVQPTAIIYSHDPYARRQCNKCHFNGFTDGAVGPFRLKALPPQLCYQCHNDFPAGTKVTHGPAAAGACTQCHEPHEAVNKKLLVRSGQELCLYCHEKSAVMKGSYHKEVGDRNCLDCHDPHGGSDRSLLKAEFPSHLSGSKSQFN